MKRFAPLFLSMLVLVSAAQAGEKKKHKAETVTGAITSITVAEGKVTLKIGEQSFTLPTKVAFSYVEKKKSKEIYDLGPVGYKAHENKKATAAEGTIVSGETAGKHGPKLSIEVNGSKTSFELPAEVSAEYNNANEIQRLAAPKKKKEEPKPADAK